MRFPNPFINTPPVVKNHGDWFEITAKSGKAALPSTWTRHAIVGLYMALQQELARDEGVTPRELCLRIADEH